MSQRTAAPAPVRVDSAAHRPPTARDDTLAALARVLRDARTRAFLTADNDDDLVARAASGRVDGLCALPALPGKPRLLLLPVHATAATTLGYALPESLTGSALGRVVRDEQRDALLFVGSCTGVTELMLWTLAPPHSASISRFHAHNFATLLASDRFPDLPALRVALLSHTACDPAACDPAACDPAACNPDPASAKPKDCRARFIECFRGVSRLGIFKRDIDAGCCRRIAQWVLNVASRKHFVCPMALLMGTSAHDEPRPDDPRPATEDRRRKDPRACRGMAVWELLSGGSAGAVDDRAARPSRPSPFCPRTWAASAKVEGTPLPPSDVTMQPVKADRVAAAARHTPIAPFPLEPCPPQHQRRLARLAPAPAKTIPPTPAAEPMLSEVEERRRKAELRKARNRESAQRSNFKRKMRLQALKEELERVSLREKDLRAREKDLREENISLRMTVSR